MAESKTKVVLGLFAYRLLLNYVLRTRIEGLYIAKSL